MTDQVQTVAATLLQTATAMAPALAVADPKAAAVIEATTLAMNLLQAAMAAHAAGIVTSDQLLALFASTGQNLQSTHNAWSAMNAQSATAAAHPAA